MRHLITISGGFHGAPEITMYPKIIDGMAYLSNGQRKRADNHCCGISDCLCGGLVRADVESDTIDTFCMDLVIDRIGSVE